MKNQKFLKSFSNENISPELSFKALIDPIRSKIIFEVVLKGEVTADMLVESTGKSRSTISHHLKKLVESGILEVFMNPVGKVKYYRITQNIEDFTFRLDREKFMKETIEERSKILIELDNMIAIVNNLYSNLFSEYVKLLQQHQPFNDVTIDEKGVINYKINNKKHQMPHLTFTITGEEEAMFVREKIRDIMKEYEERFNIIPDRDTFLKQPKYILNLQIFEYIEEKELIKKG